MRKIFTSKSLIASASINNGFAFDSSQVTGAQVRLFNI